MLDGDKAPSECSATICFNVVSKASSVAEESVVVLVVVFVSPCPLAVEVGVEVPPDGVVVPVV